MTDDQLRAALLGLLAEVCENASDIAEVLPANVRTLSGAPRAVARDRLRMAVEALQRTLGSSQRVLAALEDGA